MLDVSCRVSRIEMALLAPIATRHGKWRKWRALGVLQVQWPRAYPWA